MKYSQKQYPDSLLWLIVANLLTVIIPLIAMVGTIMSVREGDAWIMLIVFPVLLVGLAVAVVNILIATRALRKYQKHSAAVRLFLVVVTVLSTVYIASGMYMLLAGLR